MVVVRTNKKLECKIGVDDHNTTSNETTMTLRVGTDMEAMVGGREGAGGRARCLQR